MIILSLKFICFLTSGANHGHNLPLTFFAMGGACLSFMIYGCFSGRTKPCWHKMMRKHAENIWIAEGYSLLNFDI